MGQPGLQANRLSSSAEGLSASGRPEGQSPDTLRLQLMQLRMFPVWLPKSHAEENEGCGYSSCRVVSGSAPDRRSPCSRTARESGGLCHGLEHRWSSSSRPTQASRCSPARTTARVSTAWLVCVPQLHAPQQPQVRRRTRTWRAASSAGKQSGLAATEGRPATHKTVGSARGNRRTPWKETVCGSCRVVWSTQANRARPSTALDLT